MLVRLLHRVDAFEAHLLDESILQRLVNALYTSLGLRAIGVDDIDVELEQGTAELSEPSATCSANVVDPEYRVLVAIKSHWLAVLLEIAGLVHALATLPTVLPYSGVTKPPSVPTSSKRAWESVRM